MKSLVTFPVLSRRLQTTGRTDASQDPNPAAYCKSTGALSTNEDFSHGGVTYRLHWASIYPGNGTRPNRIFENGILACHLNSLALVVTKAGDSGSRQQVHLAEAR